jgi:hypothetical protein
MGILGNKQQDKKMMSDEELIAAEEAGGQPQQRQSAQSTDLMKMLGGQFGASQGEPGQPPRSQFYDDSAEYQSIGNSYVPISKTYQAPKYEKQVYEPFVYDSPKYEGMADELFGHDENDRLGESDAIKETGIGSRLFNDNEGSQLFENDGKIAAKLFGGGESSQQESAPPPARVSLFGEPVGEELMGHVETIGQQSPINNVAEALRNYQPTANRLIPSPAEVLAAAARMNQQPLQIPQNTMPYTVPMSKPQFKIKRKPGRPRKYPISQDEVGIRVPNQ